MISENRVEAAVMFIRDQALKIGQLRGQKEYLLHRIKIERSQHFLDSEGTVAERESEAWVCGTVVRLCDEYRDCITELETLMTRVKAAELTVEVWRSQNANQRRGNI
jgi:hypothetical protein